MIEVAVNRFYKGVDYDSSEMDVSKEHARELVNARILNVDGQGYIVVPYGDNQLKFSLTAGYQPIGAAVYNGIAYIFSTNGVNGEIGTYPSPTWGATFATPCGPGFTEIYRPLFNFFDAAVAPIGTDVRDPFNTPLLAIGGQIEAFARIDFDNSVNIYFTDNVNPVRKINSGFDQQGNCTGRNYFQGSFPGDVNLLISTCTIADFDAMTISTGGSLKYGNHFLALRYVTSSNTKGDFLTFSEPIQIAEGLDVDGFGTNGGPGSGAFNTSSNRITIDITNLDIAFTYFEIAYIRFFDNSFEPLLIDNLYPITGSTSTITITGSEPTIEISIDNILSNVTQYDVAKTITQVQNRLWRGNLSLVRPWDQRLVDLSRAIVARPSSDEGLGVGVYRFGEDNPYTPIPGGPAAPPDTGYHQSSKTYGGVGYFRGEAYQFGIVFKYTDGRETAPFPVRGYDAWFDPGPAALANYNYDGVLRMPSNHQSQYLLMQGAQMLTRSLGVCFNWIIQDPNNLNQTADDIYNANLAFFQNEICGWYFVRSERRPTLDFQGPVHGTYAIGDDGNLNPLLYGDVDDDSTNQILPNPGVNDININTFDVGILPMINTRRLGASITKPIVPADWRAAGLNFILNNAPYFNYTRTNNYGIFSSDHFFGTPIGNGDKNVIIQTYYNNLEEGKDSLVTARTELGPAVSPGTPFYWRLFPTFIWDHINVVPVTAASGIAANMRTVGNVQNISYGGSNGDFRTVFGAENWFTTDPTPTTGATPPLGVIDGFNREVWMRQYVSLDYDAGNPSHIIPAANIIHPDSIPNLAANGRAIVNIYKIDPRPVASGGAFDISTWYSFRTNLFYKITDIEDTPPAVSGWIGNGDCFIQRVYHREAHSQNYPTNIDDLNAFHSTTGIASDRYYCYGNMYSIVTENNINAAMRGNEISDIGSIANTFYPEMVPSLPFNFMGFNQKRESEAYNEGYHHVLPPRSNAGADPQFPPTASRLETRIDFSEFHQNNSIEDNYQYILPNNFQDYDYRYGPINKIGEHMGTLYSVQDSAISLHYVNERTALTAEEGRSVVIGNGEILSPRQNVVSSGIGSQHQFSIQHSDTSVYGIDVFKRKAWQLHDGVEIISDTKLARSKMNFLFDNFVSVDTNITNVFPDQPALTLGINSYFDRRFKNIGWTMHTDQEVRTFVYNENLGVWEGENTFNSRYYITINSDFISFDPDNMSKAYQHDVWGGFLQYYVRPDNEFMELDFIINDKAELTKIFDNIEISSNGRLFYDARFDTENQIAIKPWFEDLSYKDAVWKENKWHLPIPRTTAVQPPIFNTGVQNQYFVNSRIRGKFAKVKLRYNGETYQYIRDVISKYRISKS